MNGLIDSYDLLYNVASVIIYITRGQANKEPICPPVGVLDTGLLCDSDAVKHQSILLDRKTRVLGVWTLSRGSSKKLNFGILLGVA